MAVNPVTLRIAFMLTLAGWRAVQGPAVATWTDSYNALRSRLHDPNESDEDLEAALEAHSGYAWSVATYTGAFELRKLHVIWSLTDTAPAVEDSRVCTFHFAKVSGGSVVNTWDGADFANLDANFSAWWSSMALYFTNNLILDRFKVYKDGPDIGPPQVPVYDADKAIGGTDTDPTMPPQVAVSVTELAGSKRYWGRFYLPAPGRSNCGDSGRWTSSFTGAIADATDTLYEACKTDGLYPVVYRKALPAREQKNGTELPARAASAWDVEKIQVDDVPDVIRRRRFKTVLLRTQREIA